MKRYDFQYVHGAIYVEVIIDVDGRPTFYKFLVDTGASASVLSYKNAVIMGFDMDAIPEQTSLGVYTASDKVYPKSITLEAFEALGRTLNDFSISVIDFPDDTDGVIGNDFLSLFERVKIFYPTAMQEACIEVG